MDFAVFWQQFVSLNGEVFLAIVAGLTALVLAVLIPAAIVRALSK
jgi:hypothetical protein